MTSVAALARDLRDAAQRSNQRRLLALAGDREAGVDAAFEALAAADIPAAEATAVTTLEQSGLRELTGRTAAADAVERRAPGRADRLLGATRAAVVLDAHEGFTPNVLGRVVGAVDGGGLFVLLTPPLDEWPDRRGDFEDGMAVPPFDESDVTGRFKRRLAATLRDHPGVALADLDAGRIVRDGALDSPPAGGRSRPSPPRRRVFPAEAYESCLTHDQARALGALEALSEPGRAVVVEADRGRGKSNAAGLAAGSLAAAGRDVLVAAPGYRSAAEVFDRAAALLRSLGEFGSRGESGSPVESRSGGRIRFELPPEAAALPGDPDVALVDEAAALPVGTLSRLLGAPSAGFFTTIHGYEGAGRGFSVRFRDRLAESDREVTDVRLDEPIRYARGDPVESWAFRALLLDARPAVDQLVEEATPETATYRALPAAALADDEHRLREVFGLLVLAHYRTEPDDLARLLDAPNLRVRALTYEGRVVSVALLAREGGLSAETRRSMYEGARVRGNMLPDVLTSQLRDEGAGAPAGYRVMRIATHHAVRSRGLGSRLLAEIRREFAGEIDWLGVGFGATPELLRFWAANGYRSVYLSTSRNDRSGEHSALMLDPVSDRGRDLFERHARWFLDRAEGVLSDPLRDLDPDVTRAALAAAGGRVAPDLSEREWRVVVDASYGPGLYSVAPGAFRRLALAHLSNPDGAGLTVREERLLVRKVLQARPWPSVADELGYVSAGQCMRVLGEAFRPLVDRYGTDAALAMRERYED